MYVHRNICVKYICVFVYAHTYVCVTPGFFAPSDKFYKL